MAITTPKPAQSSAANVPDTRAANVPETTSSFEDDDDDGVRDKGAAAGLTKWQKVKQHLRRFWWAYAIAGVILLAILLPIL